MTTINAILAFFAVFICISGHSLASDGNIEDDYYEMALLNMIKQKQYLLNQKQQQLNQELQQLASPSKDNFIVETEKRAKGCLKRNAVCDGRADDCCSGSVCRCALIGNQNCRCQRPGLFQKFF